MAREVMATAVNFPTENDNQEDNMFPAPQLPLEEDPFSEYPLVEEEPSRWTADHTAFRSRRGRGFDSRGFDSFVSDDGSIHRRESRADEIRNELRTMEVFLMAMNRELQHLPALDSIMLTEMLCGESKIHLVRSTLNEAVWYGDVGLDSRGWDFDHIPCDDCHDIELEIVQEYLTMDPEEWCYLAMQEASLWNRDLGYDREYEHSLAGLNSLLRDMPCFGNSRFCHRFMCIPPTYSHEYDH